MTSKSQHILFILDRSGSMSSRATDVIGGFNTYISELKAAAEEDGLATMVSLVTFSQNHTVVFAGKPVGDVEPLTAQSYRAMGNTALIDTVHDAVSKYMESVGQGEFSAGKEGGPAVLVIIFTDGHENASRSKSWDEVQELIKRCEGLGNWTFAYIGAHPDAWGQASKLNIRTGNSLDAEHLGMAVVTEVACAGTRRHRASVMAGVPFSEDFFAPEPEPETPAEKV